MNGSTLWSLLGIPQFHMFHSTSIGSKLKSIYLILSTFNLVWGFQKMYCYGYGIDVDINKPSLT